MSTRSSFSSYFCMSFCADASSIEDADNTLHNSIDRVSRDTWSSADKESSLPKLKIVESRQSKVEKEFNHAFKKREESESYQ